MSLLAALAASPSNSRETNDQLESSSWSALDSYITQAPPGEAERLQSHRSMLSSLTSLRSPLQWMASTGLNDIDENTECDKYTSTSPRHARHNGDSPSSPGLGEGDDRKLRRISTTGRKLQRSFTNLCDREQYYSLIFIPSSCPCPELLLGAVRSGVATIVYDPNEMSLEKLLLTAQQTVKGWPLDCIGFFCAKPSSQMEELMLSDEEKFPDTEKFWTGIGNLLHAGQGRRLHVFITDTSQMGDVALKLVEKESLVQAPLRLCILNRMVTRNGKAVTALYHSTTGMYFAEKEFKTWIGATELLNPAAARRAHTRSKYAVK